MTRHRAGKDEIISRHFSYEMSMLRYAYRRLARGRFEDVWHSNALIESFCVHARNLIDFFWGDAKNKKEPRAAHIAPRYVAARGRDPRNDGAYGKIHEQVVHLSYQRPIEPNEKIGPGDRKALLELIEAEVSIFRKELPQPYQDAWRIPALDSRIE